MRDGRVTGPRPPVAPRPPTPRRLGPTAQVAVDLFHEARATRSSFVAIAVMLTIIAASIAFLGQSILPWLLYPAI